MREYSRKDEGKGPELSMTSMIDVIFLLLVFFLFTTDFNAAEKSLPMNLSLPGQSARPEIGRPKEELDLGEIRIKIQRLSGGEIRWVVNRRECPTEAELVETVRRLAEISRTVPVFVSPDPETPIERVLDVYDLCRREGLAKIRFTVKQD